MKVHAVSQGGVRQQGRARAPQETQAATRMAVADHSATAVSLQRYQDQADGAPAARQLRQQAAQMAQCGAAADRLPVQRAEKDAAVKWDITHIVGLDEGSLFGTDGGLGNELSPDEGGQLSRGDRLLIDDAPVLISRRGGNQEIVGNRVKDSTGNKVHEWVRVLQIIPQDGEPRDLSGGPPMYVRKETISILPGKGVPEPGGKNDIALLNIEDWDAERIPEGLRDIAGKWQKRGELTRTKSSGVLRIDEQDMRKKKHGGLQKPSGRNWDQFDEGVNVATDMADEPHKAFPHGKGQWRIKAVAKETGVLVGVLIVEDTEPLYLRWLIGNPEIKGGGSALLAAVKKLLLTKSKAESVDVDSAYSAATAYTKAGFKTDGSSVLPGEEFALTLSVEDAQKTPIPDEYADFDPKKYTS